MTAPSDTHPASNVARPGWSGARWLMWSAIALAIVGCVGVIYAMREALLVIPPHMPSANFWIFDGQTTDIALYQSYRIMFLHVPSAMGAATVSTLMAVGGLLFIISRKRHWESLVLASAQIGLVTCGITLLTGYFWGDFAWGAGWNFKDPRLNSALILWLSYAALLLIRAGIDDAGKRRWFTVVYGLATVPLYPLVSNAIQMFGKVVHPLSLNDLAGGTQNASIMNIARPSLVVFFLAFVMLRYWQVRLAEDTRAVKAAMREDV